MRNPENPSSSRADSVAILIVEPHMTRSDVPSSWKNQAREIKNLKDYQSLLMSKQHENNQMQQLDRRSNNFRAYVRYLKSLQVEYNHSENLSGQSAERVVGNGLVSRPITASSGSEITMKCVEKCERSLKEPDMKAIAPDVQVTLEGNAEAVQPEGTQRDLPTTKQRAVGNGEPGEVESLCDQCAVIDFKSIYSMNTSTEYGIPVTGVLKITGPGCAMCRAVQQVISAQPVRYRGQLQSGAYHLRAYNALRALRYDSDAPWANGRIDTVLFVAQYEPRRRLPHQVRNELFFSGALAPVSRAQPLANDVVKRLEYQGRVVEGTLTDYKLLRQWLRECADATTGHHKACASTSQRPYTYMRVIDICTNAITPLPAGARYLALSYVWGQTQSTSSVSNADPLKLPDNVPRTIRDATLVVEKIGERFLWVDQYCILKGEHKIEQIQNMDTVYECAFATIVAAAGIDYNAGLCGVSASLRRPQPRFSTDGGMIVSTLPHISHLVSKSKWITRGWTFQEVQLSRRCLFFTESQVYFVCRTHVMSEAAVPRYTGSSATLSHRTRTDDRLYPDLFSVDIQLNHRELRGQTVDADDIRNYINTFNQRELTYSSDAFDAFRGILKKSRYHSYWGIPFGGDLFQGAASRKIGLVESFLWSLLWCSDPDTQTHATVSRRSYFPTWSWLSLTGKIRWPSAKLDHRTSKNVLLYVEERSKQLTPFNELYAAGQEPPIPGTNLRQPYVSYLGTLIKERSSFLQITCICFTCQLRPESLRLQDSWTNDWSVCCSQHPASREHHYDNYAKIDMPFLDGPDPLIHDPDLMLRDLLVLAFVDHDGEDDRSGLRNRWPNGDRSETPEVPIGLICRVESNVVYRVGVLMGAIGRTWRFGECGCVIARDWKRKTVRLG